MTTFSANLGFLFTDRALPDAIRAAHYEGFDAVECHWPFATPTGDVNTALTETGLAMLGLNTRRGDPGEMGLSAVPGREIEARLAIDEAMTYAVAVHAGAVHVMAGNAPAMGPAFMAFLSNLRYACQQAEPHGITVLIEPLNLVDNPGYYLNTVEHALGFLEAVERPNLKILFDCYHAGVTERDVIGSFDRVREHIGHVQFAGMPGRAEPDTGELDYGEIFAHIEASGWTMPLGAEYRPSGRTEDTLTWMHTLR